MTKPGAESEADSESDGPDYALAEAEAFVIKMRSYGARAVKIGGIEVVFGDKAETLIGFDAPRDPYAWDDGWDSRKR